MKENILRIILPVALVVLLLAPHLTSFSQDYDAAEGFYSGAGRELAEHGMEADLSAYYHYVANPIITSVLLSAGYRLFGESPLVSRLTVFLLPAAFSIFLYFYLRKKEGTFWAFVAVALVVVNPIFMLYSRYIGSDPSFFSLASMSLVLLIYESSSRGRILSAILLGLSLATKYLTAFLFPVALVDSFARAMIPNGFSKASLLSVIRLNFWYYALALAVAAPFLLFGFLRLGGISSGQTGSLFVLRPGLLLPRFSAYLMWLGIFIGPFFPVLFVDLWKRIGGKRFSLVFAASAVVGLVVHLSFSISSLHTYGQYIGEMNLLGLEPYFAGLETYLHLLLFLALVAAEVFLVSITLDVVRLRDAKTIALFSWIVVTVLLMSFIQDAQRYLLAVLVPLSIYMAFVARRLYSAGWELFVLWILAGHAVVFLAIGSFLLGLVAWAYHILKGWIP